MKCYQTLINKFFDSVFVYKKSFTCNYGNIKIPKIKKAIR